MRIKINKEPGIVLTLTEREARYLKFITRCSSPLITVRELEFKKDLRNLLTKVGVI